MDGEQRVPVVMTNEAREFMYSSGPESAKFPQALSEAFQLASLEVTISMEVIAKDALIATNEQDKTLLVTTICPTELPKMSVVMPPFVMYTNTDDLKEVRVNNVYGFNALKTAQEYTRLYRQHYKDAS